MRAAIYTRVSSEEQIDGTSLDTQRERCLARSERENWDVVATCTDEGVSGTKGLNDRPGLAKVMGLASTGQIDVLLVTKIDRLGRSVKVLSDVWSELAERGVALVPVDDPTYDETSTDGRFKRGLMGLIAEWERDAIRDRTRSGVNAKVRAGGWGGGQNPPFGYQIAGKGREARLEIDEREAHVVHEAVTLIVDHGLSTLEAAKRLNALGLTPRNALLWTSQNLRNCLIRGQWDGTWTFGKSKDCTTVPEPIPVAVEPVLEADKAAALKAHLQRTRLVRGAKGVHPLSGRLMCTCGQPMTGIARSDRANRRYRCRHGRHEPGRPFCAQPSVLADAADAAAWSEVVTLLADPDLLMAQAREHLEMLAGAQEVSLDVLAEAEAAVQRTRKALSQGAAKCMALGLDDATTVETIANLREQHNAAQRHLSMVAAVSVETAEAQRRMESARDLAKVARHRLVNADRELQAQVFAMLDVQARIVFNDDGRVHMEMDGSVAHDLVLDSVQDPAAPGVQASSGLKLTFDCLLSGSVPMRLIAATTSASSGDSSPTTWGGAGTPRPRPSSWCAS